MATELFERIWNKIIGIFTQKTPEQIKCQKTCDDAFLQMKFLLKKQTDLFEKIKDGIRLKQKSSVDRLFKQFNDMGEKICHLHFSIRDIGEELARCTSDDRLRELDEKLAKILKDMALKADTSETPLNKTKTTLEVVASMKEDEEVNQSHHFIVHVPESPFVENTESDEDDNDNIVEADNDPILPVTRKKSNPNRVLIAS